MSSIDKPITPAALASFMKGTEWNNDFFVWTQDFVEMVLKQKCNQAGRKKLIPFLREILPGDYDGAPEYAGPLAIFEWTVLKSVNPPATERMFAKDGKTPIRCSFSPRHNAWVTACLGVSSMNEATGSIAQRQDVPDSEFNFYGPCFSMASAIVYLWSLRALLTKQRRHVRTLDDAERGQFIQDCWAEYSAAVVNVQEPILADTGQGHEQRADEISKFVTNIMAPLDV